MGCENSKILSGREKIKDGNLLTVSCRAVLEPANTINKYK